MTRITALDQVSDQRLTWPSAQPRTAYKKRAAFKAETAHATAQIEEELRLWRITAYVVSRSNQRLFAGDVGAAVWWLDRKRELRVLACDKWDRLGDNLRAICLTLDAMRALERWGAYTAEQAAEGTRAALPPPAEPEGPHWSETLGVGRDWPLDAIQAVWKTKAEKAHPDRGGSSEAMAALNAAMDACRKELTP